MNLNLNEIGERQSKLVLERIGSVSSNFGALTEIFGGMVRKESKVRNNTDDLAKCIKQMADTESLNISSKNSFENLSQALTILADHKDLQITRIDEKVLTELGSYEIVCRNSKEEIKNQIMLRDKELSKRKHLELNRNKSRKPLKNNVTESEILRTNLEVTKILKNMTTISEQFEQQKITDLKEILTNFILIQLKYHSAALEVLTASYQEIASIDEKGDLEQFKKNLQQNDKPHQTFRLNRFRSQSLGAFFSHSTSTLDKIPKFEKRANKRQLKKNMSQSSMSLNSMDSMEEIRKESTPIELAGDSIETKTSDDSEEDEDSDLIETETTESPDEDTPKPSTSAMKLHQLQQLKRTN
ncbi:unnamed protein product [Diamesa hyperborea]